MKYLLLKLEKTALILHSADLFVNTVVSDNLEDRKFINEFMDLAKEISR